jgi:type II secretory pathway pseudopilin PulG
MFGLSVATLVAAVLMGASQASAIELLQPAKNGAIVNQQFQNQLMIQQNEQMRENYQFQQKLYREQDRPRITPQQMEIPVIRPSCQLSGYPPGCR